VCLQTRCRMPLGHVTCLTHWPDIRPFGHRLGYGYLFPPGNPRSEPSSRRRGIKQWATASICNQPCCRASGQQMAIQRYMPSYRIVVDRDPPRHQSILWIDREDDEAALITAAEVLSPWEIGQVWEDERLLGCVEGLQHKSPVDDYPGASRLCRMVRCLVRARWISGVLKKHSGGPEGGL
jgi:hypothetical protein